MCTTIPLHVVMTSREIRQMVQWCALPYLYTLLWHLERSDRWSSDVHYLYTPSAGCSISVVTLSHLRTSLCNWFARRHFLAARIRDHIRSGTSSWRGTVQHSRLCGRSSGSEETRTTSLKDKCESDLIVLINPTAKIKQIIKFIHD